MRDIWGGPEGSLGPAGVDAGCKETSSHGKHARDSTTVHNRTGGTLSQKAIGSVVVGVGESPLNGLAVHVHVCDAASLMLSQLLETPLSAAVSRSFIAGNSTVRCTALVLRGTWYVRPGSKSTSHAGLQDRRCEDSATYGFLSNDRLPRLQRSACFNLAGLGCSEGHYKSSGDPTTRSIHPKQCSRRLWLNRNHW
jgi:hypothetical protein